MSIPAILLRRQVRRPGRARSDTREERRSHAIHVVHQAPHGLRTRRRPADARRRDGAEKGIFLDGAGLQPLGSGAQVRLAGGTISVTDGPFPEAKEVVGGYALCETEGRQEAVEFATKFMDLRRRHWPEFEGFSEVRPLEKPAGSRRPAFRGRPPGPRCRFPRSSCDVGVEGRDKPGLITERRKAKPCVS